MIRVISSCHQLFRPAGSVSANTSEGYSRRSKRDQARFYRYALGSARECRGWYFKIRHCLEDGVLSSRLKLLTEIIRMLLYIVPTQRDGKISEPDVNYLANENPESKVIENIELQF